MPWLGESAETFIPQPKQATVELPAARVWSIPAKSGGPRPDSAAVFSAREEKPGPFCRSTKSSAGTAQKARQLVKHGKHLCKNAMCASLRASWIGKLTRNGRPVKVV